MPQSTFSDSQRGLYVPRGTIPKFFSVFVPEYQSRSYGRLAVTLDWEPKYADEIRKISEKRHVNRCNAYLIQSELGRARAKIKSKGAASLRFGVEKLGQGYTGERGDFCLVGGAIKGGDLTLFYRSLELIGGFAYDLTLIRRLEQELGVNLKTVTIYACQAFVFALRGNSNEKLYPKLQGIFNDK